MDDDGAKTVEAIKETIKTAPPAAESPALEPETVSIWGVTLLADEKSDVILLKFLRAHDFRVKDAFTMLKNTIEWRKNFNIEALLEEDLGTDLDRVVYISGVDKEGHPVCYNVYGEFNNKGLYENTFVEKPEKFLRWRVKFLERTIRKDLDFSQNGVCQFVQVNDLKGSPGPYKRELKVATDQALKVLQDNYPEFVAKQGVTVCPAYPVATKSELGHMVRLTRPVIGFAMSAVLEKLPEFPFGTIVMDSQRFEAMKPYQPTGTEQLREVKVEQSDRAAILFSSGTTGRVKGVELTHRNLIALVAGYYYIRSEEENVPHTVLLFFIPMYHVFGFFMLFRGAALGETFVLMERFDFEKMLKAVETYKVTYMPVSPPLVVAFAKSDLTDKYDLSSLRLLGSGGAPLGKEVSESFSAKFPGIEVIQGYGLTEAGGSVTRMIEPHEKMKFGSVGLLSESLEAKIVDPTTGEALPPNQRGELWLRGATVMRGYVGDDDATRDTFDRDNWLKTGDLCYFDSDGFIYIVDRLKELIKYKAYQVPPAELEHLLQGHPEIADAAVVPYPDEEAGQIPMAFIVRKSGSKITAAQIMDFIANQVSPYKKIRRVAFINSIPKSPAGKILRRELVNHAVSGASSKL